MKVKFLVLFFVLSLTFFSVGCRPKAALSVRLSYENETIVDREYAVSFRDNINAKRYGSLEKYREKTGLNALEFLRKLNKTAADAVESACQSLYIPVEEPDFTYLGNGKFSFTEGRAGKSASAEEAATLILSAGGKYDGAAPCRTLPPLLSADDLKIRTEAIASFSSDYSSSSPERKHNIALAVSRLDNRTVEGRKTLSFNEIVGKRTKENGFFEAGVISYGEFTRGVGGGVCQVSTTLYDAWMLAGLEATSKNHSLTVSYVPAGLDAMVSESNDLILTNTTDFPVFLDADCDGNKVTFTLYGTKPTYDIRLWSKKERTYPCDEYESVPGEEEKILSEPKDGSLYLSFRDFYKNGVLIRREKLRTSEYRKVKGKKITIRRENQDLRKASSIKIATFL